MRKEKKDFDVIIIGSGIGGLTCGARLSKLGYKVGVFEKHFLLGGYATNFKRKGYNFDVSLHGIGGLQEGGNPHNILKYCDVLDKIKPIKNKQAYVVSWNEKKIEIPNDLGSYKKMLINIFPSNEKEILKLFKDIDKFNNGFQKMILNPNSSFLSKISTDVLTFINWSGKTTYDVVSSYVKNEEFIRLFTALWTYYGLPPKELSAVYFFIPWISYHYHGKYYIEGGAQKLSDAFVEVINENNGEIFTRSEVDKINYDNNKVTGITLKDGRVFTSNFVVSNSNPTSTAKMLPKEVVDKYLSKKIFSHEVGCTLSQLYIGLKCNPTEIGIDDDEVFFFKGNSHEEDYNLALNNKYEESGFLLTNYNNMDKNLNHKDKGVLTVTYIDNYDYWSDEKIEYKKQKTEVIEKMLVTLEEYYPKIRESIDVIELGTPKTMERYTGNPKGAVYGYAQSVKQAGRYRLKSKTSIKNLYSVGAWVNPGGGYEGTISSGMVVAQQVHKIINNKIN